MDFTACACACSSQVFQVNLLVTLLDSGEVAAADSGLASGVLEAVQIIEKLAATQPDIQDFNTQEENIKRFGERNVLLSCYILCSYVLCADGCDKEVESLLVDGQVRGELDWPELGIGWTTARSCPCSQVSIAREASRVCGGDFLTGGVWVNSDVSPCQFDPLAFQLCAATVSMIVMLS